MASALMVRREHCPHLIALEPQVGLHAQLPLLAPASNERHWPGRRLYSRRPARGEEGGHPDADSGGRPGRAAGEPATGLREGQQVSRGGPQILASIVWKNCANAEAARVCLEGCMSQADLEAIRRAARG